MRKSRHNASGRPTTLANLQQLSAESGAPYGTLRDLVIEGRLPRVQLGDSRRIWVRRADWDRLIATSVEAR